MGLRQYGKIEDKGKAHYHLSKRPTSVSKFLYDEILDWCR